MPQREGYVNSVEYVVSLGLVFTICIGLLRLWIRKSAYGRDDVVIGVATLVAFGHIASVYAAISYGLGKPWAGIQGKASLASLNQASIAGVVLFVVALYLSKCAMLAFLSRITKTPAQIMLYHTCNGAVGLLGVVSLITALADCPTGSGFYWAFNDNIATCPSEGTRWQVITALDVITEVLLLALPIHLVWNLHMPLSKKALITVAFWIRLPALGFSIGRNYYTLQLKHDHSDPGLDSALVIIWLEAELAYAIGASTLSALKAFTESINTGFGLGFTRGKGEDSYGLSNVSGSSGGRSKNEKTTLASPSRSRSQLGSRRASTPDTKKHSKIRVRPVRRGLDNVAEEHGPRLRPDGVSFTTNCVSTEPTSDTSIWRGNISVGSESSDEMVIHRETAYEVQHDEAPILPYAYPRA